MQEPILAYQWGWGEVQLLQAGSRTALLLPASTVRLCVGKDGAVGGLEFRTGKQGMCRDIARDCGRFGSGTFEDQQEGPVEPLCPHGTAGAAPVALCWGMRGRSPSRVSASL